MTADTATFELPPTVKVDDCQVLRSFLVAAQEQPVTINCANVIRLGGLGAQLLLMGRQMWSSKGLEFTLSDPSDGFTESLSDLGLSNMLSLQRT